MQWIDKLSFANPYWLIGLALPILAYVFQNTKLRLRKSKHNLSQFIDSQLEPHVVKAKVSESNRGFKFLWELLFVLIILALASPRLGFETASIYEPPASGIIILDLNSTMTAEDVKPSRIRVARAVIQDILTSNKAIRFGIVGFGHVSHLITPITDDHTNSIRLLPYIKPNLVNRQQGFLQTTIDYAESVLQQEPGRNKFIVFISDGNFAANDRNFASKLPIHVVAIGTKAGAPFRLNSGQYAKDEDKLIFSQLNPKPLKKLKNRGGSYYNVTSPVYNHSFKLLKNSDIVGTGQDSSFQHKIWHERFYIIVALACGLLLFIISRGLFINIGVIFIGFSLISPKPAYAVDLDLLLSNDKRAERLLEKNKFLEAGRLFSSDYNKGVAAYRAGHYPLAEVLFSKPQAVAPKSEALYNLANSQLKQLKLDNAIDNYKSVLKTNPNHMDAKFNLAIAEKLKQEQEQEKNESQDNQDEQNEQQEQDEQQEQNDSDTDNTEDTEQEEQKDQEEQEASIDNNQEFENKILSNIEGDLQVLMRKKFMIEEYKYDSK